ncbi:hypothetical protein J6590_088364 [Homalodisca vitripennis]|nr:hypothetical protein J6590_088364 [Homalodisca vitripennis]
MWWTLVELSSQTVILPQTPCNSFLVQMYIRSVQLANNEHAIFVDPGGTLLPNRHLTSDSLQQLLWSTSTSDSLQQLFSGPHLHQVSAASHVTMSRRYVVDPLVELSSQTVILPQTPCNSFSLVHIYIRSVQLAS